MGPINAKLGACASALRSVAGIVGILVLAGCGTYAHIKVVDQHNNPVEGVLVRSDIQPGNAFFFSGERTVEYTDHNGRVQLPVGRWFRLTKVEKEGYQFRPTMQIKRKYGSSMLGRKVSQFTAANPLVLRAWKRGEQPELTYVSGQVYFPDDVHQCTLTLVEPNRENGLDEPLVWRINLEADYRPALERRTTPTRQFVAEKWHGWTTMSGARVKDTDDLFMNRAPAQGYQTKVTWGPFAHGKGPDGDEVEDRQLFVEGEGGAFYGGAVLFLRPDNGTKADLDEVNSHRALFQFWFNFNGSTNIMRRAGKIWWDPSPMYGDHLRDTRVHCREDPED